MPSELVLRSLKTPGFDFYHREPWSRMEHLENSVATWCLCLPSIHSPLG